NRSVFWFHPLAWWLERHLATLAEEACDSAALARGHDPQDYSEYLLHQARAIQRAGTRLAVSGVAMTHGDLAARIQRLLDSNSSPAPSRARAAAGAALCLASVAAFAGCQLGRVERAAPGQPTMNELMHRRADKNQEMQAKQEAILARARSMTSADADA